MDSMGYRRLCGACVLDTYVFTSARSSGPYQGVLKEVLHLFKFERRKNLGSALSLLLYETLTSHWKDVDFDVIIPVPLHKKRRKERGFNQSEVLVRKLGGHCGVPVSCNNLIRVKYTLPQVGLSDKKRATNVKNAFSIKNPAELSAKRVLLVDDVFTTGATISECGRVLLHAGAREVYVLTLARVMAL